MWNNGRCWSIMAQLLWERVWQFPAKLDILWPSDLAISLLDISSEGLNIYVHTKTCTQMFLAALSITAPNWKQPWCFSLCEQIKLLYIHSMEYFSVLKRNELSSHETTCGNFKCILLSESSSPSEKSTYYMFPNTYILNDILGKVRLWRQTDPWLPRVGWEKDD